MIMSQTATKTKLPFIIREKLPDQGITVFMT